MTIVRVVVALLVTVITNWIAASALAGPQVVLVACDLMSSVTCQTCQKTSEPYGDFGPNGVIWKCGNVECAAQIIREEPQQIAANGGISAKRSNVVVPIREGVHVRAKETTPRSLDSIADELRARKVVIEIDLKEKAILEAELTRIDLMLAAIEGIK